MLDFYFNKESDYSEENISDKEDFRSAILQFFQFEPNRKKRVVMRAMRKKLQKQLAIRRYSSKYAFLKIWQISQENTRDWSPFLIQLQAWSLATLLKTHSTKVFSCEISEIFKNASFLQNTSSGYLLN